MYVMPIYLFAINLFAFLLMGRDKKKAVQHKYRISERTLWTVAFLFGAPGMFIGMQMFRHKTKHSSFKYGLPILSILEIGLVIYGIKELA